MQRLPELSGWLANNDELLGWLAFFSALVFVVSLALIPWLIVRIPADYFTKTDEHRSSLAGYNPLLVAILRMVRNTLAVIFLLVGLLLLVLPGQGLLTMFLGLVIADFPRKHQLVNWLVAHPSICRPMNWLRRRADREPIVPPKLH